MMMRCRQGYEDGEDAGEAGESDGDALSQRKQLVRDDRKGGRRKESSTATSGLLGEGAGHDQAGAEEEEADDDASSSPSSWSSSWADHAAGGGKSTAGRKGCARGVRRWGQALVVSLAVGAGGAMFLLGMASSRVRHFVPPLPQCADSAECVVDFVRTSYRVWSAPPVWPVEVYKQWFDLPYAQQQQLSSSGASAAQQQEHRRGGVSFTVVGGSGDPGELAGWLWGIHDTWGDQSSSGGALLEPLYIVPTDKGRDSPFLQAGFLPPFSRDQVLMVDSSVVPAERGLVVGWMKVVEAALMGEGGGTGWHFVGSERAMAFPQSIRTYVRGFREDLPVILGRVTSSASSSLQGAVASMLLEGAPREQQRQQQGRAVATTWVSVDSGLVMSWKAAELITDALRRSLKAVNDKGAHPCPILQTFEMTINRCAWESGVFLADVPWILDSVEGIGARAEVGGGELVVVEASAATAVAPGLPPENGSSKPGQQEQERPMDGMAVSCFCALSARCTQSVQRSVWVECKLLLVLHQARVATSTPEQMDELCGAGKALVY